jgi:hypothetical protein
MPRYQLVRRFQDGHEESSDFDSGLEAYAVGDTVPLGGNSSWVVVAVEDTAHLVLRQQLIVEEQPATP